MKKEDKDKKQWFYVLISENIVFFEKDYVELEEHIYDIVSRDNKYGIEDKCEDYFWNNVEVEFTTYEELKKQKYKFWRK